MENRAPRNYTVGRLRTWHIVLAWCDRCKRRGELDVTGYAKDLELRRLERRLRCRGCGRVGCYVLIEKAPR